MKGRATACVLAAAALVLTVSPDTAFAADGQKVINQSKAMAGGVTPGDAPGFPVSITRPGSYVLTGNLTVPNADTNGILISADHVTLNLNGFAILGPVDCSGGCDGDEGSGTGVTTAAAVRFNITIRNGTVQGMGFNGIGLFGDSNTVEDMHVRSNGANGITLTASADAGGSIVRGSTVERNGVSGIFLQRGIAINNVVSVNRFGISVSFGTVSNNFINRNSVGLNAFNDSVGYFANSFVANHDHGGGGVNLGQNLCDGSICP